MSTFSGKPWGSLDKCFPASVGWIKHRPSKGTPFLPPPPHIIETLLNAAGKSFTRRSSHSDNGRLSDWFVPPSPPYNSHPHWAQLVQRIEPSKISSLKRSHFIIFCICYFCYFSGATRCSDQPAWIHHLGPFEISNGTISSHATFVARAASTMQMSYTNKTFPVATTCRQFSSWLHKNWNAFKMPNCS